MTTAAHTELHYLDCWMMAILDTAENFEGTEWDTKEQIIDGAYDAKVTGLSTCTCADHDDYPETEGDFFSKVTVEVAASRYM